MNASTGYLTASEKRVMSAARDNDYGDAYYEAVWLPDVIGHAVDIMGMRRNDVLDIIKELSRKNILHAGVATDICYFTENGKRVCDEHGI